MTLIDFVKTLTPVYRIVYRDIALGYALLFGTLGCALAAERLGAPRLLAAAAGAISVGYWIAYLMLFIHEGAHWNLAADRARSDRCCNLLVGWLAGLEVASYRKVHFQHHRALGTIDDSEHSYFFPLNLVFVAKGLFGLRALEVVLARRVVLRRAAPEGGGTAPAQAAGDRCARARRDRARVPVRRILGERARLGGRRRAGISVLRRAAPAAPSTAPRTRGPMPTTARSIMVRSRACSATG